MGTKRTIDTGRRDILGRAIKVSESKPSYHNIVGDQKEALQDFSYGGISTKDSIIFLSCLTMPGYFESSDYTKLIHPPSFLSERDKELWDESATMIYSESENVDVSDMSFEDARNTMREHFKELEPDGDTDIVSLARSVFGISAKEKNFMGICQNLIEDKVRRPRKKKVNKKTIDTAQQMLEKDLEKQDKDIFLSFATNDENLGVYPLGGDIYQIIYDDYIEKEGKPYLKTCLAYFPQGLEKPDDYVFTKAISGSPSDYRYQTSKNNIFEGLNDSQKKELLLDENATGTFDKMFHSRESASKMWTYQSSIDYFSLWEGKMRHGNRMRLNDSDYRELTYFSKFQNDCDNSTRDFRENYDSDIEAFHAAKHGVVLTGEKSNKKLTNNDPYNASSEDNESRKQEAFREGQDTIDAIDRGVDNGKLPENIGRIIYKYSHSAYHSYYEESMFEGSTNKSFIMRKSWSHDNTVAFDKAIRYLEDNTPRKQRTLFRLAEIPQGHTTVESYAQTLEPGDVVKTLRASSSTMIGKPAVSQLLGRSKEKIVYRYNTSKGVSIADARLAEVEDEGEVIIPKDSEFVVTGSQYDEDSKCWIVDVADR